MARLFHFRLVGMIQIGSCVLMIFWLPFFLTQKKNVPDLVHMTPTPKLETTLSPRSPGSFQWEIVSRNYTVLAELLTI